MYNGVMYRLNRNVFINQQFCSFICLIFHSLFSCKELKMLNYLLNAQVIKQDNVSETIIILKRNKVSTMMKKFKADYYFNLFDEVDTAAAYWRLLKKTSGTTKVNRQAHQLKKDDGTLTTDETEKAAMLNEYFCTIAEKLIGPADEIQPLHAHSRQNLDIPTTTSITISQMETLGKDL